MISKKEVIFVFKRISDDPNAHPDDDKIMQCGPEKTCVQPWDYGEVLNEHHIHVRVLHPD